MNSRIKYISILSVAALVFVVTSASFVLAMRSKSAHLVNQKNQDQVTVVKEDTKTVPDQKTIKEHLGFTPGGVPVLMYHYIGDLPTDADPMRIDLTVPTADFEAQMTFLQDQGYTSITPDQLYAWMTKGQTLPKKSVMITFDDGYTSAFDNAIPILLEHHFVGTFGVITGFIGTRDYAGWNVISAAKAKGMTIVSHSFSHINFAQNPYTDQEYNIAKSTVDITENLGFTPNYFIYPFGAYNLDTEKILQAHGYVMSFTTAYGFVNKGENLFELPRVRVHGKELLSRFEYDVAGIPLPVDKTATTPLLQMPSGFDNNHGK